MALTFGDCELDLDLYELRRGGEVVALEPQVFSVLAHLVTNRDAVVSKEQLLDEVWGDRFVSESALTSRIKAVRSAIGDDGRSQRYIKTVHGRGYRFVADVTEIGNRSPTGQGAGDNLPSDRTPMFGRERDIDEVATILEENRLVTLLGIGGTGKTRLAISVGRAVLDRFADGVWFADLVPVADSRSVVTAMADAAGLALSAGSGPEDLAGVISERSALFILDNCEHVIDQVADVVDALMEHTERPRFLLTSREPIGLHDERRVPLEPLSLDAGSGPSPAVDLFLASAERFGVDVADEDRDRVLRICTHLDGLPLAIELAAAQLRQLSISELAERLDQRFELLATGGRRAHRHASLGSVLEDTWGMLDGNEQLLLNQLCAFPGGFDLASVEQVCAELDVGPPALTLAGLIDRGLVTHHPGRKASHDLLETVRLFGRRRTDHGTADDFATRHSDWCLAQVGPDPTDHFYSWELARWNAEHHDDLRAAERHLRAVKRVSDAAALLTGTALAMHMDPGTRASACLERIDEYLSAIEDPSLVARLHLTAVACGMATRSRARIENHGAAALEAAQLTDSPIVKAVALVFGSWSRVFADSDQALEMVDRAESIASNAGLEVTADLARVYRASHLLHVGRIDEAVPILEEIMDRRGESVDYTTYTARNTLMSALALTDPEIALQLAIRFEGRPSTSQQSWSHAVLRAALEAAVGHLDTSLTILDELKLRLARACNDDGLPDVLLPAALAALRVGDEERCRRWLTAIRRTARPTQSFQATSLFRQMRARVGLDEDDPLARQTLPEIDREARRWMASRAGQP